LKERIVDQKERWSFIFYTTSPSIAGESKRMDLHDTRWNHNFLHRAIVKRFTADVLQLRPGVKPEQL
jgi:hypothetical protein